MENIQKLYDLVSDIPNILGKCETCKKYREEMTLIESCERDECMGLIEEISFIGQKISQDINIKKEDIDVELLNKLSSVSSELHNTVKKNCRVCSIFDDNWNCGWEQCHLTTNIYETVELINKSLDTLTA